MPLLTELSNVLKRLPLLGPLHLLPLRRLLSISFKVNPSEHRSTKGKEDTKGKSKGKFLGCGKQPYLSE